MNKTFSLIAWLLVAVFLVGCTQSPANKDFTTGAGMLQSFRFLQNSTSGDTYDGRTALNINQTTATLNVGTASQVTAFMNCTNITGNATLNPVIAFSPIRFQYSPDNVNWFNSTNIISCTNNASFASLTDVGMNFLRAVILSNASNSTSNMSIALIITAR